MLHTILSALALVAAAQPAAQTTAAPTDLRPSAGTLDAWSEFIRPSGDELSFERIAWRNAFWPAIEEARELGRPVLLWTMNGHPLGCT